jgi:hypothetical protein
MRSGEAENGFARFFVAMTSKGTIGRQVFCCSSRSSANGRISVASLIAAGCLPSRIAATIAGREQR